jgi:hypothetical protein
MPPARTSMWFTGLQESKNKLTGEGSSAFISSLLFSFRFKFAHVESAWGA